MSKRWLLLVVLLVNLLLSTFGSLAYKQVLLNNLFLTSLLLLMIGGSLFLLESGFFNMMIYGFKKYFSKVSSAGRYVSEETNESEEVAPFEFSSTNAFLVIGALLFTTTFIIGLII